MAQASQWIEIAKAFLAEYWIVIVVAMLVLYYTYHYAMLIVSIVIFPVVAIGGGLWQLNKLVAWPDDEDNKLTPGNFFFFLAGCLAFFIEIWLFSIFLEAYLLGESIMPIFGTLGIKMSIASGIGFGMLTLIFGHLAHHLLGKEDELKLRSTSEKPHPKITADKVVGWAAALFFFIATIVLGYSGGLRAHTLATHTLGAGPTVIIFSVIIGAIFGFMMPFGAVVGMSRGGFLWHIVKNILLGIPLMIGMILLLIPAFIFYLFEILLNLLTMPISKIFSILAGFAGIKSDPHDQSESEEVTGWRIGVRNLLSSAQPPERLRRFLEYVRQRVNFWDVDEPKAVRKV